MHDYEEFQNNTKLRNKVEELERELRYTKQLAFDRGCRIEDLEEIITGLKMDLENASNKTA